LADFVGPEERKKRTELFRSFLIERLPVTPIIGGQAVIAESFFAFRRPGVHRRIRRFSLFDLPDVDQRSNFLGQARTKTGV